MKAIVQGKKPGASGDAVFTLIKHACAVLADGAGGMGRPGDDAKVSAVAVKATQEFLDIEFTNLPAEERTPEITQRILLAALRAAERAVKAFQAENFSNAATTMTLMAVAGPRFKRETNKRISEHVPIVIVNVGDSGVICIDRTGHSFDNRELTTQSNGVLLLSKMLDRPDLPVRAANVTHSGHFTQTLKEAFGRRNIITEAVGIAGECTPEIISTDVETDRLLIAISDGYFDNLTMGDVQTISSIAVDRTELIVMLFGLCSEVMISETERSKPDDSSIVGMWFSNQSYPISPARNYLNRYIPSVIAGEGRQTVPMQVVSLQ